ncbi:hypothetical protein [Actinophytocola sp.]|uniref:hypothetical protein n=1 Tax=Actinophytocola sp. TaxID=1872138 RepID=UPI002D7EF789|nr:hypothetical protein [Actinophytocola sp.]HET9139596.1 hypothetical protein [Actinophytocola sp.]
MTTPEQPQPQQQPAQPDLNQQATESDWRSPHRWVIIVVILGLIVTGLILYRFHENNEAAQAKANELIAALKEEGLSAPTNIETITSVLGTDGGAVCEDPGGALQKAILDSQLVNGASYVGMRPVRAKVNVVRGETVILEVYCPDKVEGFQDSVRDYVFDNDAEG